MAEVSQTSLISGTAGLMSFPLSEVQVSMIADTENRIRGRYFMFKDNKIEIRENLINLLKRFKNVIFLNSAVFLFFILLTLKHDTHLNQRV